MNDATRGWVVAGLVAMVGATFAVSATLAYDAWAWLGWAREILRLDLNTTGGPSWKPLPVMVALPLAPAGDLAPTLWLVASRALSLLAVVAAYRLARRLTGASRWGVATGILAACLLFLTPDVGPRFTRLLLEGHTAPWTAALAMGAVDRHLAGRRYQAYLLLVLLSLDRPEAWPFLLAYGGWLILRHRADWRLVTASVAVSAALWFGVDWWGSGSPFHGADIAQVWGEGAVPFSRAWRAFLLMVPFPVWLLAGAALARAVWQWRAGSDGMRHPPTVVGLMGGALVWSATVLGMNLFFGFAGISRFFLPAAALVSVVAAVELVTLGVAVKGRRRHATLAVALALLVPAALRAAHLDDVVAEVTTRGDSVRQLEAVIAAAGGPTEVRRCPPVSIDIFDAPRPALAWHLDLPLAEVRLVRGPPGTGTIVATAAGTVASSLAADPLARRAAAAGQWEMYRRACPW